MCSVLAVSKAGFYRWCGRPESARAQRQKALVEEIRAIHFAHKRRYGSPRMHQELQRRGHACGRHQIADIMRKHGIAGRVRRKKPWFLPSRAVTDVGNILNRQFTPGAPNQAWAVDFKYIPTSDGWLFLAVVMDLFSRRIVGRSLAHVADERFVMAALDQAIRSRRPPKGLLHHSDQGSVYKAVRYGKVLAECGLTPSMSRRGNCHDNAVVESFFASIDRELLVDLTGQPRLHVEQKVLAYIDQYYNRIRLHSTLGFTSPVEYEMKSAI